MKAMRPVVPDPHSRVGPIARLALIAEILWTYARARRLMNRVDLPTALRTLRGADPPPSGPVTEPDADDLHSAQRLGRAVMMVLERLPTDQRCLVRSLVVSALLARRGLSGVLTIGVRPDQAEPFVAHAWVEMGGTAVIPTEGYSRLHSL